VTRLFRELWLHEKCGLDRWNSSQLAAQLEGDGFELVGFGQGFASMSAPTKELEALVIGEKLIHPDQPVLNWMCANTVMEMDAAGNVKPSKKKSTERIDGIVASIMAIGRLTISVEKQIDVSIHFI